MVTKSSGGVTAAQGFEAAAGKAGIKKSGSTDLGIIVSANPCTAAGVYTTNQVRASSVDWCQTHVNKKNARAIICNSGNANACTGKTGEKDTRTMAALAARAIGASPEEVFVASTGVIGHTLPMNLLSAAIPQTAAKASSTKKAGLDFARAIMTTDLAKKEAAVSLDTTEGPAVIGACAKGSGMIHPNLATMLVFITTDLKVSQPVLQRSLTTVCDKTFNNLTIDGDTSTNDMVLILANGVSQVQVGKTISTKVFEQALFEVCNSLCKQIASDGEGATKRIEIRVSGGKTEFDAQLAANAVARSNLVKTAVFGNDPNWGRIACAVGYSGARFSDKKIAIAISGVPVFKGLQPIAFNKDRVSKLMKKKVVPIDIHLGTGKGTAIAQTCDFTYDYVRINAEYTT